MGLSKIINVLKSQARLLLDGFKQDWDGFKQDWDGFKQDGMDLSKIINVLKSQARLLLWGPCLVTLACHPQSLQNLAGGGSYWGN